MIRTAFIYNLTAKPLSRAELKNIKFRLPRAWASTINNTVQNATHDTILIKRMHDIWVDVSEKHAKEAIVIFCIDSTTSLHVALQLTILITKGLAARRAKGQSVSSVDFLIKHPPESEVAEHIYIEGNWQPVHI